MADIPEDVIDEYTLRDIATQDGWVYIEVLKGMYGLPQAGLLAQQLLEKRLNEHGYHQSLHTPGLWTHETRPVAFTLVVDDFGVKYVGEEHARHLMDVLQQHYTISHDWGGTKYAGVRLDWDYQKREVHLSIPGYVQKALTRFQHEPPKKPQHQPYPHTPPNYGQKVQYAKEADTSQKLDKKDKKFIQEVTGVFLFYARAVDNTMLVALSAIASEQAEPTVNTMIKTKHFLDYAATHPDAVLTFRASDMILAVHSNALYLNEPEA